MPARARTAVTGWAYGHAERLHPVALAFALTFFAASMTPSLLPRAWYLQAVATGLSSVIGYGLGCFVVWVVRGCGLSPRFSARTRRLGWRVLGWTSVVVVPLALVLGTYWQRIVRELVGRTSAPYGTYLAVLPLALLIAATILLVARGIRALSQRIILRLERFLPAPVARLIGVMLVVVLVVLAADATVQRGLVATAERAAQVADRDTPPGVVRPTSPLRSGSPESPERWETLGSEGRRFVAGGSDAEAIGAVTQRAALEPIRVYAGRDSAGPGGDERDVAARVVAELDRTGAFERGTLAVATTTGTGWVNETIASAFEHVTSGDCAIAAMQYSYLPSPVAFVVDRETPRAAGQALLEAVQARLATIPEVQRPRLVVFGESLGSYGSQAAFPDAEALVTGVDGALLVGTPGFAEPWGTITANRDAGSLERLPVVDGGAAIRFAASPEDLQLDGAPWGDHRIVFWQHASDPITWWSTDLLLQRPDWLREPAGPDVDPGVRWFPVVTFWQVSLDMVFSLDVPDGHGHAYGLDAVDLWAAILQPEGWDGQATARVRAALAESR